MVQHLLILKLTVDIGRTKVLRVSQFEGRPIVVFVILVLHPVVPSF